MSGGSESFETLIYSTDGPVATVTLNRPDRLNTIVPPMPDELEATVHRGVADESVKMIVVRGAGRAFCAGPILGGLMRNTPDAKRFIEYAEREGVSRAAAVRDEPFGDYGAAPPEEQPDPNNVIEP